MAPNGSGLTKVEREAYWFTLKSEKQKERIRETTRLKDSGDRMDLQAPYMPTPEQIAETAAEIRAGWTAEDYAKRSTEVVEPMTVTEWAVGKHIGRARNFRSEGL